MSRFLPIPCLALAVLVLTAGPALAQDDVTEAAPAAVAATPDSLALARVAEARGDNAEALSRYLRVLSTAPDDVGALVGAGRAALAVGDVNAAAGFLARADALDPRNGEVKAGLAETMVQNGNARGALRLFNDAVGMGVAPAAVAADRGLAYDLRGDQRRAQADYQLALRTRPDSETLRRLAISQAIAGDRSAALATLDPLLRKQDVPAWRARAFVLALTGSATEALEGAALVMPRDQVDALAPYLSRLATLKPGEKAAAIHLGRFPGAVRPPTPQVAKASIPRLPIDHAVLAPPVAPPPAALSPATPLPARQEPAAVAVAAARPLPAAAPVAEEPAPDPAREAARARAEAAATARAEARARAAAKAKAEAAAREKQQREQEAEERAAAKSNPARHWVQVAGGANKNDLGREWNKLKAKWPKQLAGRTPWTTHYRFTNRLLIGPFPTSEEAQDWVSDRRKEGFATFRVETNAGDPVERVD